VRHLVQTGSPDALAMLDHLIHYLRTSLPEIRSESSTLGREAELARAYLEILRLRMGGALEIAIDIPPDLALAPFPPLMVMTLVENAIKHGVAPQGRGRVSVSASAGGGKLRVVVEDDGRGLGGTVGRGVGLANVRERLAAIFGPEARRMGSQVNIDRWAAGGDDFEREGMAGFGQFFPGEADAARQFTGIHLRGNAGDDARRFQLGRSHHHGVEGIHGGRHAEPLHRSRPDRR